MNPRKPYDPMWLVELAKAQEPEKLWLHQALAHCICYEEESRAYFRFVDHAPETWQFETNIILHSREHGDIVLDILTGERVGGIELLRLL